ncbi:MAG: hypothetical protein MJE68_25235, partial [Proteobacteria bacterium]|nr:hypothetical protein [Pseudomonadota bacterium]
MIGVLPYNTYLFPAGGTLPLESVQDARTTKETEQVSYGPPSPPKTNIVQCVIGGENLPETEWQVKLTADDQPGLKQIRTPYGIFPFIVNAHPETVEEAVDLQTAPDEEATQDATAQSSESEILFQTKCSACHELRSPSNRALSAEEWSSTITRMADKENADITNTERDRIIAFVAQEAERLGELVARQLEHAQHLTTPGAISGRISEPGEVDYYRFTISEGTSLGPWWVIFPFDNVDEKGFDTVYPPETEIDLEKEYIGKDGRKIGWYRTNRRGENVFSNVPEDDVTGYALTYLES